MTLGIKSISLSIKGRFLTSSLAVISSCNGTIFASLLTGLNSNFPLAVPITSNPAWLRALAIAKPIPLEAPVINATLFI